MSPTPVTQTCADCGATFQTVPVVFGGKAILTKRVCDLCATRREEARRQAREQQEAERLAELWTRVCPPLFQDNDPARLRCRPEARDRVLNWCYGPRGLLIAGPPRTGKTRLAFLLLSRLHHVERRQVIAVTATTFAHQVATLFGEGGGHGERYVDKLAEAEVLFIDDVGKARLTDRVEAEFFHIIDERSTHLRPTILTTNLNAEGFNATWSADRAEPLVQRFLEFFDTVTVVRDPAPGASPSISLRTP